MFEIQRFVLRPFDSSVPDDLYVRLSANAGHYSMTSGAIVLNAGGVAHFDTYFNAISVAVWRQHCDIADLTLQLWGQGRFLLRFGHHRTDGTQRWLEETEISLDRSGETEIPVRIWASLQDGLLYASLTALEPGEIARGRFVTRTRPVERVVLGIVITHYNRQQWVLPAIRRIQSELIADPAFRDRISLIVVDNSRNINSDDAFGATLLPNENLGGSGGFARGLLHLEECRTFTHCLFMDDDASCEIESIRRTFALLSFAKTPKFAVAGALLREVKPHRLYEKGAIFDGMCRPLCKGLNMRMPRALVLSESEPLQPNYGGWWFFAFRIKDVQYYPFPFFVRGDDITFALTNTFNICTMIGVASWGDDFELKSGPMTAYLDMRYHIFIRLVILQQRFITISSFVRSAFFSQIYSYNYASAESICLALEHVCKGSQFWLENLDMSAIRAHMATIPSEERLGPVDRSKHTIVHPRQGRRHLLDRLIRRLTFNGQLLPRSFLKRKVVLQKKSFHANAKSVFRHLHVLHEYEPRGVGYIATHDRQRFIRLTIRFWLALLKFRVKFHDLGIDHKAGLSNYTRREFWEHIYRERPRPSLLSDSDAHSTST